jgi:hypothetical protein
LNCQFGQGYMFARPLAPAGIELLLGLAAPPVVAEASAGSAQVRTWARAHGFAVADRGPVPGAARRAYVEAHS